MSRKTLRGVVFDMDGVLVDSHAVHWKAWRLFFVTLGREAPERELDFILDGRKPCDILRHFLGNCPDSELEEFGRHKDCIFEQMRLDAPVPGAVRLVSELHRAGVGLALATPASRSRTRATSLELGLLDCFPIVVTGGRCARRETRCRHLPAGLRTPRHRARTSARGRRCRVGNSRGCGCRPALRRGRVA